MEQYFTYELGLLSQRQGCTQISTSNMEHLPVPPEYTQIYTEK